MSAASDLESRLSYLNLQPRDLELLRALKGPLEQRAPEFVDAFYRHLVAFPRAHAFLRDSNVRRRLLDKQREYLLSLAGPVVDEEYVRKRRQIGLVHEEIGLEPRWYIGAFALYLALLTPMIFEVYHDDPLRARRTLMALQKLLLLDAQLTIEAYIDRHEADLEALTEELQRSGLALAEDLAERRLELRQTTARAKEAEELASVATLVAGLAHEIGTPMSVIQGHAAMLEHEVQGDEARWRLQTIQDQIGRISNIIQALLNMARPGKSSRSPVALESILDTTLAFVTEKLARRGIRVVREIEPAPSVVGDAERLQQVFLNLFLNAADAMPRGGELQVSLRSAEPGWVEVRVADEGTGMPPEVVARIFEPFFSTKAAGKGSGLGLAVTRGIVVELGGSIEVETRPGHGTEFIVRLPVFIPASKGA